MRFRRRSQTRAFRVSVWAIQVIRCRISTPLSSPGFQSHSERCDGRPLPTADLIHNIEIADLLIQSKCDSVTLWLWQKQLRFYLDDSQTCVIRMVDAHFFYTYEYQGNAPKLVHTPLTDKCYLTLTQGMHLGYGGNPYGPAGTGKTESVKTIPWLKLGLDDLLIYDPP